MYKYFATLRPVGYAQVPDGYDPDISNCVYPPSHDFTMLDAIKFNTYYGTAVYKEPISFERLDRFTMYPIDEVEFCAFMLWKYCDKDKDDAEDTMHDYIKNGTNDDILRLGNIGDIIIWIKNHGKEKEVCEILLSS